MSLALVVETDENGDSFEVWLTKRSFGLLAPVCRLGLQATLLFLMAVDPLYFLLDLWSKAVPHALLVTWHLTMALFFAGFLLAGRHAHSHVARQALLKTFFAGSSLLFVWFGVVSWLGTGDLSIVAIAQVVIAAVFSFPGNFRRRLYGLQALALGLCLAWLDGSEKFIGQMHFVNVPLIAFVAYTVDGYMLQNAQALFSETCRVALERQRADAVLYNALPMDIADELKAHQCVQARRYPAMAILYADIVGFTAFAARRAPDQVLELLGALFSEMDALLERHGVEKIKTIGDAYMAVSHDDASAVAALALDLQTMMPRFNAERGLQFALRIGLHCGPTIAGVIGHKRFLYDVWGDAVNLASRMESTGEPGRIQTTDAMVQALGNAFCFTERGLVAVKGKGPTRTYYLQGVRDSMRASDLTASG